VDAGGTRSGVLRRARLATNHGWLELPADQGQAALPRFLQLAADQDLYVLVVALAGTKEWSRSQIEAQVSGVGQACAAAPNCILELANEPYHPSQHSSLYSLATMKALRKLVPATVPVTYGAPRVDEPLNDDPAKGYKAPRRDGRIDDGSFLCDGSDFVVLHKARRDDIWDDQRRYTELAKVAHGCNKRVVDDEPFGFAETPTVGTNKRRTEDYAGFGQGVLSQLFSLDSTFHCDDCLTATPLGAKQIAAAKAFIAGRSFIPAGQSFRFANAKSGDSAVRDASLIGPSNPNAAALRIFSFFGPQNLIAIVGLRDGRDPAIQWQGGWRKGTLRASRPGLELWEIAR
jgi:hypothetical protein